MSVEEWRALPWWQSEMYLEGLETEMRANTGEQEQASGDELAQLTGRGFKVRRVG